MSVASPSPCCQSLPKDFFLTATNRPWNTDCCSLNQLRLSQCIKQQDGDAGESVMETWICSWGMEHNSTGIIFNAKGFLAGQPNCSISTDGRSPAPQTQLSLEQLSIFLVSCSVFQLNSGWRLDGNREAKQDFLLKCLETRTPQLALVVREK